MGVRGFYPFGSLIPTRTGSSSSYRYGFNGKEKDDEIKGEGIQYDYGFRIYDARIGRFLSMDPLFAGYPYYTPYQFAGNRPIWAIDLDGLEEKTVTATNKIYISNTIYDHNNKLVEGTIDVFNETKNEFETISSGDKIIHEGTPGSLIKKHRVQYNREPRVKIKDNKSYPCYTEIGYWVNEGVLESNPNETSISISSDPNNSSTSIANDTKEDNKPAIQTQNENNVSNNVNSQNTVTKQSPIDTFNLPQNRGSVNVKLSFLSFSFEKIVGKLQNTKQNNAILDKIANTALANNTVVTITLNVPIPTLPGTTTGSDGKYRPLTKKDISNYALIFRRQGNDVRDKLVSRGVSTNNIKVVRNTTNSSPNVNVNFK